MSAATLYARHQALAVKASRGYYLPGCDVDDVHQEARVALWKAARSFDPARGCSFSTYAWMTIRAHMVDLLRGSSRHVRSANVNAGELDVGALPHLHQVSDVAERHEELERLVAAINALPPFERRCVVGIAAGLTYAEIGPEPKRIDNALYRARRTLRAAA